VGEQFGIEKHGTAGSIVERVKYLKALSCFTKDFQQIADSRINTDLRFAPLPSGYAKHV